MRIQIIAVALTLALCGVGCAHHHDRHHDRDVRRGQVHKIAPEKGVRRLPAPAHPSKNLPPPPPRH